MSVSRAKGLITRIILTSKTFVRNDNDTIPQLHAPFHRTQGALCFQIVIQFHVLHINVIPFTAEEKYGLSCTDFHVI